MYVQYGYLIIWFFYMISLHCMYVCIFIDYIKYIKGYKGNED